MSVAVSRRGARPFSAFERMVAWRYLRSRRKETMISVISIISFIGIMLGVATLIIVMAALSCRTPRPPPRHQRPSDRAADRKRS